MLYHQTGPVIGTINYLTFWGNSQGMVNVQGNNADEEHAIDEKGQVNLLVSAPGGAVGCIVNVCRDDEGFWSVGLRLVDSQTAFPDWPLTIMKCPYSATSTMLRLEVPYGTMAKRLEDSHSLQGGHDGSQR